MDIESIPKNSERMIVLDETWRLVRNSEEVGILFREGRKYGFSVIVATQLASDISNEVLSNAASVFLFRMQNDSDYRSPCRKRDNKRERQEEDNGAARWGLHGLRRA